MPLHLFHLVAPTAALIMGLSGAAGAQQAAPNATIPEMPSPARPGSARGSDPCTGQPDSAAGDDQTLTGQLSRCGGVLTPPSTGDDAQAPVVPDPDPNTTPVVPPGALPDQAPNGGTDPSSNSG